MADSDSVFEKINVLIIQGKTTRIYSQILDQRE